MMTDKPDAFRVIFDLPLKSKILSTFYDIVRNLMHFLRVAEFYGLSACSVSFHTQNLFESV